MTLLLAMLTSLGAWADQITAEEALRQAQTFLTNRRNAKSDSRRTSGIAPQLTMKGLVSGLYLFNVSDGGFVIVSNDDNSEAILGYSDSGAIDPSNMPDNMRAWLQDYANAIAWAREHKNNYPALSTQVPASESSPVRTPIAPLIATTWYQFTPYNNLCPEYEDGRKSATGCVATAMAQTMYYTETKAGNATTHTTAEIPEYTTASYQIAVDGIAAGSTINWSDMIENYGNGYTEEQATAIAILMKYCGTSVRMDYGPESGANLTYLANALKNYFGYSETTTHLYRSEYSYADWLNLLYNELCNGRVIPYSGLSSNGPGHAFICDGYDNEDFFHINWGWSGMYDGYFKLSALSPSEQGATGSNSTSGYHYGHDAVVGIQKEGDTGTVLDVPTNNYDLTLNSLSVYPTNITYGESANYTINVTNNGEDEFDGDFFLYVEGIGVLDGKTFVIGAGETKDCVITFKPRYTGTLNIYCNTNSGKVSYRNLEPRYAQLTVSGAMSDIDMTISDIQIDNAVFDSTFGTSMYYKLYGTTFKGTVRVNNPSTTTDYNGIFLWALIPKGYSYTAHQVSITVPRNSYIDVPIPENELQSNVSYYTLKTGCTKGNSYILKENGIYFPTPAITTFLPNGKKTIQIPSGTTYDATENAPTSLVVDVTGTGITNIIPNDLANTLYISDQPLSGLEGKNVVTNNNSSYTANNIAITDGSEFYTPVNFTADRIEFTYNHTVAADGMNGWNTIMLPYDVTKVTADGTEIDWFHSSTDKGKNFWLKSFTSDDANQVYFDFVDEMRAYTPYIVAFPGDKWGDKWNMYNKTIKFIGEDVTVNNSNSRAIITGLNYRFIGNTVQDSTQDIYCLNDDGNAFVLNENSGSNPFRAYFKPYSFDRNVNSLGIGNGNTTLIGEAVSMEHGAQNNTFVYDLQGRRVSGQLQHGLYIKNSKKILIP